MVLVYLILAAALAVVGIAMLKEKTLRISVTHVLKHEYPPTPTPQQLEEIEKENKDMPGNISDMINMVNKFMLGEEIDE